MAKSLRSKVKKRWRMLKTNYLAQVKVKPELQQMSKRLQATVIGVQYRIPQKSNAFLHPEDPTAQFPQLKPQKHYDLRSTSIPGSGTQYRGASRKHNATKTIIQTKQANDMQNQQAMQQQIKITRSLIKKDKFKKSKLRKLMVF